MPCEVRDGLREVTPAPHTPCAAPSSLLPAALAQNAARTQAAARVLHGEPIKNKRISKTAQRGVKNHQAASWQAKASPLSCARSWGSFPHLLRRASDDAVDVALGQLSGPALCNRASKAVFANPPRSWCSAGRAPQPSCCIVCPQRDGFGMRQPPQSTQVSPGQQRGPGATTSHKQQLLPSLSSPPGRALVAFIHSVCFLWQTSSNPCLALARRLGCGEGS